MLKFIKKDQTLAGQVRWKISSRILICIVLILGGITAQTFFESRSSLSSLKESMDNDCRPLEDFIISQTLVPNKDAINLAIHNFNNEHTPIKLVWIDNYDQQIQGSIKWRFPFYWIYYYPLRSINNNHFGWFVITGSFLDNKNLLSLLLVRIILLIMFSSIVLIILYPLGRSIPNKLFVQPVNNLLHLLKNNEPLNESLNYECGVKHTYEINEIKNKLIDLLTSNEKKLKQIALGELATQVAHDIRSPLAVLQMAARNIRFVQEDQRVMIRSAIQRITDIANNLLIQHNTTNYNHRSDEMVLPKPELIAPLVDNIVSEKRMQYLESGVTLIENIDDNSSAIFARVNLDKFKRLLSNLINNAFEASSNKGEIQINLFNKKGMLILTVVDAGCGISPELLPAVLKGASNGKPGGTGLGLSTSVRLIESWGGSFLIQSQVERGTTVEIRLPETLPADWFLPEICIKKGAKVIILDDDESIHHIWNQRLLNQFFSEKKTNLIHFVSPAEFVAWHEKNYSSDNYYLIDYEFIGTSLTGLDLIEKLNIADKSLLVTSRYEDSSIRLKCLLLGIKMIPKNYSIHIPIKWVTINAIHSPQQTLVFIDDDAVLTKAWRETGELIGKQVLTFNSIEEFMPTITCYPKTMVFYVDSDLGNGEKGENLVKRLHEMGYDNLYLATGHSKELFSHIRWVKGVVGKDFPF